MLDAVGENQHLIVTIGHLQEDLQAMQLQMDAAKQDALKVEVDLAQEKKMTESLMLEKQNLEQTMQQFHKAYDELDGAKRALLSEKGLLEQQLADTIKATQAASAEAQEAAEKANRDLIRQHEALLASATLESNKAIAAKDQELNQLKQRQVMGFEEAL